MGGSAKKEWLAMTWRAIYHPRAEKMFSKLNTYSQNMIQNYLNNKVLKLEHPTKLGKRLTGQGKWKGYLRYRVDQFRIICDIKDHELIILVMKVGHRNDVYDD